MAQFPCSKKGINLAEKNGQWRGDKVGYNSLHSWVRRRKYKPGFCEDCHVNTDVLDLANVSGLYLRNVDDFKYLCRLCHMKSDGRLNKLLENAKSMDVTKFDGWKNRKIRKGGEVNTNVLSEKQVRQIRKLAADRKNYKEIGKKFGVMAGCVSKIMNGVNWKWLK